METINSRKSTIYDVTFRIGDDEVREIIQARAHLSDEMLQGDEFKTVAMLLDMIIAQLGIDATGR